MIYFFKNERVHADDPLKLSQIITHELFKIRMAILQSVSEYQGYEKL